MRYLHKPTLREHFVASGIYKFYQGERELPGIEHWGIYALPDDSHFVRIDADWRGFDGTSLLAEALITAPQQGARFERYTRHLISDHTERENYDFFAESIIIGYDDENGVRQDHEAAVSAGYAVLLPVDILIAYAVNLLGKRSEPVNTFLGFDIESETALFDECSVQERGIASVDVDGKTLDAHEFALTYAASPSDNQRVWLDSRGVLLRRESGDGTITKLSQYAYKS